MNRSRKRKGKSRWQSVKELVPKYWKQWMALSWKRKTAYVVVAAFGIVAPSVVARVLRNSIHVGEAPFRAAVARLYKGAAA